MTYNCEKEGELGEIREFIKGMKGLKATIFTISFAILLQVGMFIYLWGGLTTTVQWHDKALLKHDSQFESLCAKLDKITMIAYAGEKGEKGDKSDGR